MKKKSILTEIAIYVIFTLIALFSFTFDTSAQAVVKDAAGNYLAVKDTTSSYKATGKTYTTKDGTVYPVYVSKNGKLFVRRISKTGNPYNFYLKVN